MSEYDDYDWEDPHEDYCDHDEYDIDILTGRCECSRCPTSWYATDDQIRQEIQRQATYYEDIEREERRQWWRA